MPADAKNFYERFVEPSGIIWFRPLRSGLEAPAAVQAENPRILPSDPAPVVIRPKVLKPLPDAAVEPAPDVQYVALPIAPIPVYTKQLTPAQTGQLYTITNRLFRMYGKIDLSARFPEGWAGAYKDAVSKSMLVKYLEREVFGGTVLVKGTGMQRVFKPALK